MNFIFKIVENHPESEQIVVKYCRQNSLTPIDDCQAHSIDYKHIDFTDYDTFKFSIMLCGKDIIIEQLKNESGALLNYITQETNSISIEDNLNKILPVHYESIIETQLPLNSIEL
jgi:hypothetical protein